MQPAIIYSEPISTAASRCSGGRPTGAAMLQSRGEFVHSLLIFLVAQALVASVQVEASPCLAFHDHLLEEHLRYVEWIIEDITTLFCLPPPFLGQGFLRALKCLCFLILCLSGRGQSTRALISYSAPTSNYRSLAQSYRMNAWPSSCVLGCDPVKPTLP